MYRVIDTHDKFKKRERSVKLESERKTTQDRLCLAREKRGAQSKKRGPRALALQDFPGSPLEGSNDILKTTLYLLA